MLFLADNCIKRKIVIIFALASIVLAIFAQELLSTIFSCCVCLIVLLYWITFHILNRKY